jgi:hypothetical protein
MRLLRGLLLWLRLRIGRRRGQASGNNLPPKRLERVPQGKLHVAR